YRRRAGENATTEDYRQRFPDLGSPAADSSTVDPHAAPPDAPAPAPAGLTQAGRYQLGEEIGRGGIGHVFEGYDPVLRCEVAVKVLREEYQGKPELVQRFIEEAQIGSQLQHPGVVPVHDRGILPDGRPYFVMKRVRGRTLADLVKERPDPAHELPRFLKIFEQVCQTVAYAHAKRVLHRDLKPRNIMVGAFAEVHVMDWGFAKVLLKDSTSAGLVPAADPPQPSAIETVRTGDVKEPTALTAVLATP